jgi:hypothetical protein
MLNLAALNKIVSIPKIPQREQTTLIKSTKNSNVLEGTATQRSEQAFGMVINALQANQPACAKDLAEATKLTVSCVRDKLNLMLDSGTATKKPDRPGKGKTFYFSLVATC